ncbi:chromatin remodeling 31 [Striga asiatica]|uniref:Chromatin remodeling 31 n=1 Tax=Striga asiatica TaxID=4170 RepID=A0A5A7QD58_STRAF|nr:chromatin remodeling 31 [Striga asiatica]
MSESQSKKSSNDVITPFWSSVSGRTRSRWDEYVKSVAESRGMAPSSGSVSPRKRKIGSSSRKNARKRIRGTQTKPKRGGAGSHRNGNGSDDSDSDDFVIEKVNVTELYKQKLGSSAVTSRKAVDSVHSVAAYRYSSPEDVCHRGVSFGKGKKTEGVNRRFAPNTSNFAAAAVSKSITGPFSPSNAGPYSNQVSRHKSSSTAETRNDIENTDSEEAEIERHARPKKSNSARGELNTPYPKKKVGSGSTRTPPAHFRGFFTSLQASLPKRNIIVIESDSEGSDSEEVSIEKISETELSRLKAHSKSKTRPSTEKNLSGDSDRDRPAGSFSKNIFSAHKKNIDVEQCRNKTRCLSKSALKETKKIVTVNDLCGSSTCGDDSSDSDESSSSFSESGYSDEVEKEVQKIPEPEFKKIGTFNRQHPAKKVTTSSSKRIPKTDDKKNKEKKGVCASAHPARKAKNNGRLKGNIDDNASISSSTPAQSTSTFSSNDVSTDNETSSCGAVDKTVKEGIAGRTRSRMTGTATKASTVEISPPDSESSSSSARSDFKDDDSKVGSSFTPDGVKSWPEKSDMCHVEKKREMKKNALSPSPKNDDDVHRKTDDVEAKKRKQVYSGHYGLCRMLADSVLGRASMPEEKDSDDEVKDTPARTTLPLKFRFEDEDLEKVEKTEYEIDELFVELDFHWSLQELGLFDLPKDDEETGKSSADETKHARCSRGNHELVLIDDQGLICIYCRHVELGPKDVLPEWVSMQSVHQSISNNALEQQINSVNKEHLEKTDRESARKRFHSTEHLVGYNDELGFKSSDGTLTNPGNAANGTVWSLKPGVQQTMYEHQQEGFEFLWKNLAGSIHLKELKSSTTPSEVGGCIISHAPGTGKTRLTIVFIETYMKLFPNCRPMIIAPASMLLTWEEEFRKWNVEFPFLNFNVDALDEESKATFGLLKRRSTKTIRMVNLYSWNRGGSILGISYSLFEKLTKQTAGNDGDVRNILLKKPGLVILDEGHTPRNQRSNIWNVLLKLRTQKRVILSGTPFQNNFAELFNTLRIVRPAMADSLEEQMNVSRRKYPQSTCKVDDNAVQRLKVSMAPFVHVHKGTILQQSLPGLRDCVVVLKPPPLQKSLIERLEGTPSTFEFEHKAALLSVHPYLFHHSVSEERIIGVDLEASRLNPNEGVKTKFILEFVRLSMAMKEKVLIFSQYIQPLELIKDQLKEIFRWAEGKEILQMQGKLDQKHRQVLINLFNDEQNESKVMLASTRCCSEGISLVGASRVILLDVVWNPSVEIQAISRAYRIGQKKFVYTYHLMTSGTTEADKYCRQAEKERLSELVFTSSSNEGDRRNKLPVAGIEDRILEVMVDHENLKDMFDKIINQPKDTNLIQTFGLASS